MHVCEANMAPQHARRHIANFADDMLKDIVLVAGRAGRSRVARQCGRERIRRANTETNTPLPSDHLQSDSPPATPASTATTTQTIQKRLEEQSRQNLVKQNDLLLSRTVELEKLLHHHGIEVPPRASDLYYVLRPRPLNAQNSLPESRKPQNLRISVIPESNPQISQQNQDLIQSYQTSISKSVARDKSDTQTRFPSTLLQRPADYFEDRRHHDFEPNPFEESFSMGNLVGTTSTKETTLQKPNEELVGYY